MAEFFVCLGIILTIKIIEWMCAFIKWAFIIGWKLLSLPFILIWRLINSACDNHRIKQANAAVALKRIEKHS